jgi:hypothetical protein
MGVMTPQGRTLLTVTQAAQRFLNEEDWRRFACEDRHERATPVRVGVSAHLASLGRRRAALVAHSPSSDPANRKDLFSGFWACWNPAGGNGLGGGEQVVY